MKREVDINKEKKKKRFLELAIWKCERLPNDEVEAKAVRQSKSKSNRPTTTTTEHKMKSLDGRLAGRSTILARATTMTSSRRSAATMIRRLAAAPLDRSRSLASACRPESSGKLIERRPSRDAASQPIICYYYSLLLCCLIVVGALLVEPASSAKLPDIYWNSSNPIFRIDNTDHIFDVNKKQHDHDQVDLVCPQQQQHSANQLAAGQESANKTDLERYIIYSVSKEEFESCRVDGNENKRIIAVCDQPSGRVRPVTVTFRSYTPQPNGFEYKPGQDYYFITALYNQQLDAAKRFAPCREQNMKVIFKVCCKPASTGASGATSSMMLNSIAAASQQQQPPTSSLASIIRQPSNVSSAGARKTNSQTARQMPFVSTLRPILVSSATAAAKQQHQLAALDDRLQNFVGLGGSLFSSSGQQPQPITVLPIEVHEASSTEKEETILNDIPPPTPAPPTPPAPQTPAHPLPSIYQPRWPVYRAPFEQHHRLVHHPTGAPQAAVDLIASRYPPTPLPPWIPIRPAATSSETAAAAAKLRPQFGQRPEPSPWLVSASRISLYPNFPSLNNEAPLNSANGLAAAGTQFEQVLANGAGNSGRQISGFGWTEAAALLTVALAIALIVMATKMRNEQRLSQLR